MKKGFIAAIAFAGSLLAVSAFAQTNTYNFTTSSAVAGTTGKYKVTLQKWNGTANGPATSFRIAFVQASANPNNPNDNVSKVDISFFSYLGAPGPGTIPILSITGTSGLTNTTSPPASNPTITVNQPAWVNTVIAYNGSTHLKNIADFVGNGQTGPTVFGIVKKGATNGFLEQSTGRISLKYRAFSVKVTLYNSAGTKIWSGVQNVSVKNAPEGGSLALLATGLLPLGFVVRRRLRARSK